MFDLNTVLTYISPIVTIACLCLGYMIKQGFKNTTLNAFIPTILGLVGIATNVWTSGAISLETVVTGAVSGLAATGLYEGFSNILNLSKADAADTIEIEYGTNLNGKHFEV